MLFMFILIALIGYLYSKYKVISELINFAVKN